MTMTDRRDARAAVDAALSAYAQEMALFNTPAKWSGSG